MNMEIIQEMGKSYLCTDIIENNGSDYMERMLTDNNIKGQPVCRRGICQNREILKFDITNMKTLRREFDNRSMHFEDLRWLLYGISSQLTVGASYLLDEEYYIYDPDHIYIDMESGVLNMICIPYKCSENSVEERFHELADFILEKIEHKEEHAVSIAYQFYRMSKEKLFSMIGFCALIEKETGILNESKDRKKDETGINEALSDDDTEDGYPVKETDENNREWDIFGAAKGNREREGRETGKDGYIKVLIGPGSVAITAVSGIIFYFIRGKKGAYGIQILSVSVLILAVTLVFIIKQVIKTVEKKKEAELERNMSGRAVTVGEYWGGDDNTVFFEEETQFFDIEDVDKPSFSLEWSENGESRRERIDADSVILGKKFDEVDVCLSDPTVSRKHARLTLRAGEVYLRDLGSTNGTYVEGRKIEPGEDIKLCDKKDFILGKLAVRVV